MTALPAVLLPTGYSRTEYVVLRSLAARGVTVHVADASRVGMAQWSRFAASVHRRPPQGVGDTAVVDAIARIARSLDASVIIPTDSLTMVLARERARLGSSLVLPVAAEAAMALANNKARVAELARSVGVSVPGAYSYEKPEDLGREMAADAPVVVKLPESSGSDGVYFVRGADAAAEVCRRLIAAGDLRGLARPVVQDFVNGAGWGVSALYWHGERITSFTHRRLREKMPSGGTSTLRASARAPMLEDAAHRLLGALRWHGLAMVEFKYDPAAQRYWLLEVNPRVWGSIALPVGCGIDFPWWLYLCAVGEIDRARELARGAEPYPDGRVARWVLGDAVQLARALARGRFGEAYSIAFGHHADIHDDIFADDFSAFAGEVASYATALLGRARG